MKILIAGQKNDPSRNSQDNDKVSKYTFHRKIINPKPENKMKNMLSGRWGSNPLPSPWQGDVLPVNYARWL
jgi:hypothetical protein